MAIAIGISGKKQSGKTSLAYYLKAKILQSHGYYGSEEYDIFQNDDGEVFFVSKNPNYSPIEVKDIESAKVEVYSFGDSLKETCMNTFGLTWEQCYGTDEQKNILTKYKWDNLPDSVRYKYSKEKETYIADIPLEFGGMQKIADSSLVPRTGYLTAREIMQVFGTDVARDMFDDNIWVNSTLQKIKRDKVEIAIIADVRFPSEVDGIKNTLDYKFVRLCRTKDENDNHSSEISLDGFSWDTLGENVLVVDNDDMSMEDKNELVYSWLTK